MKRLTIFIHHDNDNIIDDYVVYWLKYMSKISDVIFTSNNNLPKIEIEKIEKYTIKYIVGEHGGRSEISYKLAYLYAYENHILEKYDWLIVITDSIYGPFFDIEPFMIEKEKKNNIVYGFTKAQVECYNEHIQDTFIAIPTKIVLSQEYYNFTNNMDLNKKYSKKEAVINGEIAKSQLCIKLGYKLEGMFENIDYKYIKYDPMKPNFIEMIKLGYPFIRRTLFTQNYFCIQNIKNFLELENIIPKECFNAMIKNINRVVNKEDLKINLEYPQIRQNIKTKEDIIIQLYENKYNYNIELIDPTTFIDKLVWLKLNYHTNLILKCNDKYLVREYVQNKIKKNILLPLIGIYNCNSEILYSLDITNLPNKTVFVSTINEYKVFLDKNDPYFDYNNAISVDQYGNINFNLFLLPIVDTYHNKYFEDFEWGYKYITTPRLLIYDNTNDVYTEKLSYKIICFNSNPTIIKITIKENNNIYSNFYDLNWKLLPVIQEYPNIDYEIPKPIYFDELIEISKILSEDFPYFIAIDFIGHQEKFYFEKFDFYSNSITYPINNNKYDEEWGKLIKLPYKTNEYFNLSEKEYIDALINFDTLLNKIYSYIIPQLKDEINEKENTINKLNQTLKDEINKKENIINKLVWWIPNKKLRDKIRNKLLKY